MPMNRILRLHVVDANYDFRCGALGKAGATITIRIVAYSSPLLLAEVRQWAST